MPASASDLTPSLRVLFVCLHDFGAPTEKQIVGYARELAAQGHEARVSFGGEAASVAGEVEPMPGLSFTEHRFVGRRLRAGDLAHARAFRPTLIHASLTRLPVLTAARRFAGATGAPVFVHFGDDEWAPPPAVPGEPAYRRLGRLTRRALAAAHPPAWQYSTRASLAWTADHAAGLDALTPALAAEVERRLRRPCEVILPAMPPAAQGASGADPAPLIARWPAGAIALFTGSILPEYGDDIMLGLRAVALARARGAEVAFVHAGAVHPRLDWRELTARAGLDEDAAVSLGYVPFGAVPGLLAAADVLLQPGAPTRFNRLRLPAKMASYLEAGTPVITFAEGFAELLEDRAEVLKTFGDTPEELAERIVELLGDPALQVTLGAGGRAAAARLFDAERNTRALRAHYAAHLPQPEVTAGMSSGRTNVASS